MLHECYFWKSALLVPAGGQLLTPGCLLTAADQKLFKTPLHCVFASASSRTTKGLFSLNACGVSLTPKTFINPGPFSATGLQILTIQTIFPNLCFLPSPPTLVHAIQSFIFQNFMCADWQACTYILASYRKKNYIRISFFCKKEVWFPHLYLSIMFQFGPS